jgi:hypothetical protein
MGKMRPGVIELFPAGGGPRLNHRRRCRKANYLRLSPQVSPLSPRCWIAQWQDANCNSDLNETGTPSASIAIVMDGQIAK